MDEFKEFADAENRLRKSCERVKETLIKLDGSVLKVWLTVAEAKELSSLIGAVDCCSSDIKLTDEERSLWSKLNNRIEQAEC